MNIKELADGIASGNGWFDLHEGEPRSSQLSLAQAWCALDTEEMPDMAKQAVTKHLHDAFKIIEDYRVHGGSRDHDLPPGYIEREAQRG